MHLRTHLGAGLSVPTQGRSSGFARAASTRRSSPNIGRTLPTGGGRTQRFERQGGSPPGCPTGARSLRTGQYGTGTSTTSWRECEMRAAPVAPPPPPPPAPVITVSPAIQTQVSPQISPVMTQQQASPGASVQAQPISTPGGQQAATAPQQDIERILEAERARMAAETALEAEQRRAAQEVEDMRRAAEFQELQRQYAQAEQQRAQQAADWQAAEQQRRMEADAAAAEAADADARAATFITGAPTPIMAPMVETAAAPPMDFAPELPPEETPEEKGNMLPILLAAAAGVGLLLMRKKRGRKR